VSPSSKEPIDITGMLAAWSKGDEKALGDIMPRVYDELRAIARRHLGRSPGHVVQSGSLAHEAYLKLARTHGIQCNNRGHFFALCSQMIRRILVDHARKDRSGKRGEGLQVPFDEAVLGSKARGIEVEALNDALDSLAAVDVRKARVVELRFFGGLNLEETAEVLEISEETVARDWRVAKTWLFRELTRRNTGS
jgi:RNA polymerase sigma-70 factor (ECF subfamily)